MPRILNELKDNSIFLDLVSEEDAEFILKLRTDETLNKFLSTTSNDLQAQVQWIKEYKKREARNEEFYFIIKDIKTTEKLGTIRLYNISGSRFTWGSWIVKHSAPYGTGARAVFILYDFAFYKLSLEATEFDVRKKNLHVINFYKRLGAKIVSEDDDNLYLNYTKEDYDKMFLYKNIIRENIKSSNVVVLKILSVRRCFSSDTDKSLIHEELKIFPDAKSMHDCLDEQYHQYEKEIVQGGVCYSKIINSNNEPYLQKYFITALKCSPMALDFALSDS